MRATRALIHLENLKENIRLFRNRIHPGTGICMAVKADAYGHGVELVTTVAYEQGINRFGVATVSEGMEIREMLPDVDILLFSLPLPEEIPAILENDITPFVGDDGFIRSIETEAARQRKTVSVHLKIDTGMGRIGCTPEESLTLAGKIISSEHLRLAGICTHFPGADCGDPAFTLHQIDLFSRTIHEIRKRGIDPGMIHAANSAGALRFPDAHFDMVRPGLALYGYSPFPGDPGAGEFKPVMELESRIVFMKKVGRNFPVSYGTTYRTEVPTVLGTVAAGYADGYSRSLSNRGRVLIGTRTYPVVGRICMDQFMVDLGPDPVVRLYDKVTLFGPDTAGPSAQEIADFTGTIPYEVTCGINKRVPRIGA